MINRKALAIRKKKGIIMCRIWCLKDVTKKKIGMAGITPTPCSCWMCGNPRRQKFSAKERLSIQELREFQDKKEIIDDILDFNQQNFLKY